MSVGIQVWSQTASNNSTADTNINWAEGQAPSSVNDSARAMMASEAKFRDDNNGSIVTGGSTTAYTITSNQVSTGLVAGYTIAFQIHATNDTSATLNVDSNGAKPLQVIAGTNLQGSELQVGNIYRATYSTTGTGQWIINGAVQPGSQANIVNTTNISDNAVTYQKIQTPGASVLLGNPSTSTSTGYKEITLGKNLSFSAGTLQAGTNTPVISVFTSTGTATWSSTTQGGQFPLYLRVKMVGGGGSGASNTTVGSSGTDTSFSNWTALHGGGGAITGSGAAGTGGTDGTGTKIIRQAGQAGGTSAGSNAGFGGGTYWTGMIFHGIEVSGSNSVGANAIANTGGGGSGSSNGGTGGGGGGGGEYVEFIITSPSTAYSLTVGGGGAGVAGANTSGSGAAGRVVVEACWQ